MSKKVTTSTVKKVAQLACLEFDEANLEQFTHQFNRVLDLIETIKQVDTQHIQPMANALELTQRLRQDEPTESNQREALMANAPAAEAGLFLVPKVVE